MNRYERVKAAIAQQPVDKVPSCFSIHFAGKPAYGKDAVKAHLDFYNETGVDILKVMNENLIPLIGKMNDPSDWKKLPSYTRTSLFIRRQAELIKQLREAAPEAYILGTVHGVCAGLIHPLEATYGYQWVRELLASQARTSPEYITEAAARVTEAMCELVRAYAGAGCDGIYYAALGGEKRFFTDDEFHTLLKPCDFRIMQTAKEEELDVFLHICKDDLHMDRYAEYGSLSDVVNWGVYEAPMSLADGRRLFPNHTIMGGLANHDGVLTNGSEEEITAEVHRIIQDFGDTGLILGADCTLSTTIPLWRIRAVSSASEGESRM